MPGRSIYAPTESWEQVQSASFEDQLKDGLAQLDFQHALPKALGALQQVKDSFTPLPIVLSPAPSLEPPSFRPPGPTVLQADQNGTPTTPTTPSTPGSAVPMPTASADATADVPPTTAPPAPQAASGTPVALPTGQGPDTEDDETYIRQAAISRGIDPDTAVRVANTEGGANRAGRARQNTGGAPAYGHFQLYVGGPGNPAMGDEAIKAGIDPRDPAQWKKAIDFALDKAKERGWQPFQGAAAAGIKTWEGIGTAPTAAAPTAAPTTPQRASGAAGEDLPSSVERPTQFAQGLSYAEQLAACGPAGIAWFIAKTGHPPQTVADVRTAAAATQDWDPGSGMHGAESTARVLRNAGVAAHVEQGVDWNKVRADVQRGNPVMFDTDAGSKGHYYTVQAARQRPDGTWEYDLGTSATDLRAAQGRRWFTAAEVAGLGFGTPARAIYSDNPQTPLPSVVAGASAPTAGASPSSAAPPLAPAAGTNAAGAPDMLRASLQQGTGAPASLKAAAEPMPTEGSTVNPIVGDPSVRNIVPYDAATGQTTDPGTTDQGTFQTNDLQYRQPLSQQPYDPDQGPHEQVQPKGEGDAGWPAGYDDPGLGYPLDPRPAPTYDQEGLDRTNDYLYPGPGFPRQGPPDELAPQLNQDQLNQQMYRQPLGASTMGPDTTDTAPYDPREADSGAHESTRSDLPLTPTNPPQTSSYNDPTDQGTQSQPLPPQQQPAANDPGGTQFLAQDSQSTTAPEQPAESPLKPLYDLGGRVIGYVHDQAQAIAASVPQLPSPGQMVSNVAEGRTPGGQTPGQYVQSMTPRSDTMVAPEAAIRDIIDAPQNLPNVLPAAGRAIDESVDAARPAFQQGAQEWSDGQIAQSLWDLGRGTLDVANSPFAVGQHVIDAALPTMANGPISMGTAVTNIGLIHDVRAAAQAVRTLVNAGIRITPKVANALLNGTTAEDILALASRGANAAANTIDWGIEGASSLAEGARSAIPTVRERLAANAERMAQADARMAEQGSTAANASLGAIPPSGGRPVKPTVEVLQAQIERAAGRLQDAVRRGDQETAGIIRDHIGTLQGDLVDAQNARRALEPAITSDVGRRIEDAPIRAQSEEPFAADVGRERVSAADAADAADLAAPSAVATDMSGRMNAGAGALPASAPTDRLGTVNRVLGQGVASAISGGVGAQVNQQMNPDDPNAGLKGFAVGAAAPFLASKGVRAGLRLAGKDADLAGGARISLGDVPPSKIRQEGLPGIEHPPYEKPNLPAISDTPNAPGNRLGNAPPGQVREPTFPGMEAPHTRPSIPDVSEVPNRGPVLGDVPPSQIRRPVLPGMEPPPTPMDPALRRPMSDEPNVARPTAGPERATALPGFDHIDPLTDPTPFIPPDERSLLPSNSLQTTPEIVDNVIRQEQEQARRLARRAATKPEAVQPGQVELPTVPQSVPLAQRIRAVTEPWERRLNITRYAGMLSDTATHIFNLTSNAVLQGVDVAATPIAAALDVGRSAVTGRPRQVFFSEAPARIAGMRAGLKVGLQNAAEILRTGLSPVDAAKQLEGGSAGFASGSTAVDFAFEAPLRALAASDAVFRTSAQGGHLAAEGMAAAMQANPGVKITPDMLRTAMKDPAVLERAQKLAARSVLQEDRQITTAYQRFLQAAGPEARLAISTELPFVKTPYNVVAQGVGLTPAGLFGVVQDMAEHKPARAIEYRVARVALGTAVMGVAAADYASGNLTGPRPTDPKELSTLPPGWQPWSQKVPLPGGGTGYVPLAVLGPLALPAVAAILMGESAKKGGDMTAKAGRVALGVGQYASQNTFFQSLSNIGGLLDQRDAQHNIERNVQQVVSQFSPHIIGGGGLGRDLQRVMGMPMRDPQGALEALLATHPLTAGRVEPRQDVLGRPSVPYVSGPIAAVARVGREQDAGVIRAFRNAKEGLPLAAPKEIRDPTIDAMHALTPKQQHQWRRVFGQALTEDWSTNGAPQDGDTLRRIENRARDAADQTVLGLR